MELSLIHISSIPDYNYNIGCIILNNPFFFDESNWIPIPRDWSPNIVQGKTYDTDTEIGHQLYQQVTERLHLISGEHGTATDEEPSDYRIYGQKDESESNCNGAQTILHPK